MLSLLEAKLPHGEVQLSGIELAYHMEVLAAICSTMKRKSIQITGDFFDVLEPLV